MAWAAGGEVIQYERSPLLRRLIAVIAKESGQQAMVLDAAAMLALDEQILSMSKSYHMRRSGVSGGSGQESSGSSSILYDPSCPSACECSQRRRASNQRFCGLRMLAGV